VPPPNSPEIATGVSFFVAMETCDVTVRTVPEWNTLFETG
jgi:hypothetical protein